METLKQLPTQPVNFAVDNESFNITINSAFGQYELAGEDGGDYPKLPEPNVTDQIEVPSILLLEGINKTLFATSNDELRPAMTGVLLHLNEKGVTFVSTDAHKMVKYNFSSVSTSTNASLVLPKKALNLLKNAPITPILFYIRFKVVIVMLFLRASDIYYTPLSPISLLKTSIFSLLFSNH